MDNWWKAVLPSGGPHFMRAPAPGDPPTLLAFYYPVSPTLSVILDEVEERTGFEAGPVSVEQVARLNREIQMAAHKQVFGNSREILQSLSQSIT
jgi:hypothetical protein